MENSVFRDTTTLPPSSEMVTATPVQEIPISTDEQIASTTKPPMEGSDTTMTHPPTTVTVQLDAVTDVNTIASSDVSTITPSIVGMTNLLETPTTALMSEAVETSSAVSSDTITHSTAVPEQNTVTNSVVASDTTTHSTPVSEQSTMVQAVEVNSVVPPDTPSETITTMLPMTLPATTMITMANSNQVANEMKPPGELDLSSLASIFGNNNIASGDDFAVPNQIDSHPEIDNVLTMSSNEETTRMATSTDSKTDAGDKQTAPSAGVTEPPKPQDTNEVDNGNSGCRSISTSFALLSLAVFYVIV